MTTQAQALKTNWNQVYALLALNAAVVISWIAYHNYQPKVLELFHFQELSFFLVVAQSVILVFIPSVAGLVGDYMIKKGGNSFIVFTVGISVTAMVFMCVAFTVGTATTINLTSALPFMIVVWLISMNIFHSPANSMLELFAPAKGLPSAMALMVITTDLLYAFENKVVDFVDWIGPVSTFALGGVLLIVSGYYFKKVTKDVNFKRESEEASKKGNDFLMVVMAGLLLGAAAAIIKNSLAGWLPVTEDSIISESSWLVSFVLVVSALAAWPLSLYINKIGTFQGLLYGLIVVFASLVGAYFFSPSIYMDIVFCILIGLSFSLASVSAFPFALSNLSPGKITVGTGIFFGSVEIVEALMNISEKL
jgi:hypothetical protein